MPVAVPAGGDATACAPLIGRIGPTLDGLAARPVTPTSTVTAAWGRPAVTLACGARVPVHPASQLALCLGSPSGTCADGVQWFEDALDPALYATRVAPVLQVHVPSEDGVEILNPISVALVSLRR